MITLGRYRSSNGVYYIVSVPAFSWTKVCSGVKGYGRCGYHCLRVQYPGQMFVLGGNYKRPVSTAGSFRSLFWTEVQGRVSPDEVERVSGLGRRAGED